MEEAIWCKSPHEEMASHQGQCWSANVGRTVQKINGKWWVCKRTNKGDKPLVECDSEQEAERVARQ